MSIKKILNYRSIIMGLSMLMIMIFHSDFPIITNTFINNNLIIGVDCFLFLSGIGIAQSLNNKNKILDFYKRRLLRIIPTTITLTIIFSYLLLIFDNNFNSREFYLQITTLNFWVYKGNYPLFMWYIPCIMFYYLLSPFIFKYINRNRIDYKFIIKISIIILLLFLIPSGTNNCSIRNLFGRFPIYLIGMIYGIRSINKEKISLKEVKILLSLTIISIVCIYYLEKNYIMYISLFTFLFYIPIVILITILVTFILDKYNIKNNMLNIIGKSTLAIYCSHEFLMMITLSIIRKYNLLKIIKYNPYAFSLLFIVIGITFGIVWTRFINNLTQNKNTI